MNKFRMIGIIGVIAFICICITDGLITYFTSNQEFWFKVLEIISASLTSASFSLDFKVNINKDIKKNKIVNSTDSQIVQQNGNGDVFVDKSINNDPEAFVKAVKELLIPYQQDNIESVCKKTFEALKNEEQGEPLNKDFVIKYLSDSSTISNEDIQDIWVKLLLMENKTKGSVSKRTLDIVKNLSPDEARLFETVAELSLRSGTIYEDLKSSLSFIDISKLQDIGLIKSNDFITQTITINSNSEYNFVENGYIIIIKNTSATNNEEIQYSCNLLTSEGLELKEALNIKMTTNNFIKFGRSLKTKFSNKKDLTFSAHKVNYIDGNQINYNTNDLL